MNITRFLTAGIGVLLACALACCLMLAGCGGSSSGATPEKGISSAAVSSSVSGSASASSSASKGANASAQSESGGVALSVEEGGSYTSKNEVALYIHEFGHLPGNYISKTKAKKAGWSSSKGNLDEVCPGKSIGGGTFYNDDGILPDAPGRTWKECDIDYTGGYRGSKRIVFSNDGLVFYTDDHYKSFEQLY